MSLKEPEDMGIQNSGIKIRFFTSPMKIEIKERMLDPVSYTFLEDIDPKLLLQFSMNCSSDKKDFYFMGKHRFSLENTLPVMKIWIAPHPEFNIKKFVVSESKNLSII